MTAAPRPALTDVVLLTGHAEMLHERLAGLALGERQLFTLARAGARRAWVSAHRPAAAELWRLPEGLEVFWGPPSGGVESECRPPYAVVSGDHVLRVEALRDILSAPHPRRTSYQDPQGRGVVQIVPERGEGFEDFDRRPMPEDSTILLEKPPDKGPALPWLLRGSAKPHDGLMARVFDRRISRAVTRVLLGTPVRPNHMTVLSSALGLLGAALLADGRYAWTVAGSLLVWLHTVLDGCDGEMARLLFRESRLGGFLDFWGDNLVHVALFACLSWGQSRLFGDPRLLGLGALAAVSVAAAAALTFRLSLERQRTPHGPLFAGLDGLAPAATPEGSGALARRLAAIEDFLAQRDFVYLMVALALADRIEAFLWAGGIGAPLFLAALIYLRRRSKSAADGSPAWRNVT